MKICIMRECGLQKYRGNIQFPLVQADGIGYNGDILKLQRRERI